MSILDYNKTQIGHKAFLSKDIIRNLSAIARVLQNRQWESVEQIAQLLLGSADQLYK